MCHLVHLAIHVDAVLVLYTGQILACSKARMGNGSQIGIDGKNVVVAIVAEVHAGKRCGRSALGFFHANRAVIGRSLEPIDDMHGHIHGVAQALLARIVQLTPRLPGHVGHDRREAEHQRSRNPANLVLERRIAFRLLCRRDRSGRIGRRVINYGGGRKTRVGCDSFHDYLLRISVARNTSCAVSIGCPY